MQWEIPSSMSLENLLRIRPVGVVSKNFMGLRRIRRNSSSWSLEDALRVPWQSNKHYSVVTGFVPVTGPSLHMKKCCQFSLSNCKHSFFLVLHASNQWKEAINWGKSLMESMVQPQEMVWWKPHNPWSDFLWFLSVNRGVTKRTTETTICRSRRGERGVR